MRLDVRKVRSARQAHLVAVGAGAVAIVLLSTSGAGQESVTKGGGSTSATVDSVLDRLEKRLLDQEADAAGYAGPSFADEYKGDDGAADNDGKPPTKYKFGAKGGGSINASTQEQDKLKAIAAAIADLDGEIEQFTASVQKTKQQILDDAAVNNFVSVDAQLLETDVAAIRSLTIKLDGFPVYELKDEAGLWLPSKGVPLYAGPLQPGSHRLDLEARIVMRHQEAMPLNGDIYRFVNKSFDLSIPGGNNQSRYVITIKPPEKLDGTPDATIKEAI